MKVKINGVDINYQTYGQGEPIICIHGWNETCNCFKSPAYKEFLEGYEVFAIDLPGFGKSGKLQEYSIEQLTGVIDGFAHYLGFEQFTLLGQCLGGIIALDYAIKREARVIKLILVETMIYFPFWLNILLIKGISTMVFKLVIGKKFGVGLLGLYRPIGGQGKNMKLRRIMRKFDPVHAQKYIKLMKEYSKIDHLPRIREIRIPVRLITAQHTFREVRKTAGVLKNLLADVEHEEIKNRNHFVFAKQ